jgi:prepilin peptidase CpaA
MPMTTTLLVLLTLVLFPALMAFSASSDLFSMKISNRVSIALATAYPVLAFGLGVPLPTIATNLACGFVVLLLTFTMFSRGWIGGGDAKLAAATAPWLGWALMLDYSLLTSVLGGVLTLGIILSRRTPLPNWAARLDWVARLHHPDNGVPYGIALAAAGLALYPSTQIWHAATGL